jgi:hypothetical protein
VLNDVANRETTWIYAAAAWAVVEDPLTLGVGIGRSGVFRSHFFVIYFANVELLDSVALDVV